MLTDPANAVRQLAHDAMHSPADSEPVAAPAEPAQTNATARDSSGSNDPHNPAAINEPSPPNDRS
jgi:hypothetical protein